MAASLAETSGDVTAGPVGMEALRGGQERGSPRQSRLVRSIVNPMSRSVPLRTALLLVAAAAGACSRRPPRRAPPGPATLAPAPRRAVPPQLRAPGTGEPIRAAAGRPPAGG